MQTTKDIELTGTVSESASMGPGRIAGYSLAAMLPLAVIATTMWPMLDTALNDGTTSHIPLIPLVSAWFIFAERRHIFSQVSPAGKIGVLLTALGLICMAIGEFGLESLGAQNRLSISLLGLALIWTGVFGLFWGDNALKAASFPFEFLFFMIPIPSAVLDNVIRFLQVGSADTAAAMFQLSGVPFLRHGFEFALPGVTIQVAQECSGIRSTLALLIVVVLMCHLFLRTFAKKALLCILVVPLAVFKNGLRIFTLSVLSIYVNPGFLTGNLHRRGGIVFFVAALLPLILALSILRKTEGADAEL